MNGRPKLLAPRLDAVPDDLLRGAQIVRALNLLHGPEGVAEVRILGVEFKGTISGYYDAEHFDQAARDIAAWDGKGDGVYITLNPVPRDLLARAANRLKTNARNTTGDTEITGRRWLFLDADAIRLKGISANEAEHDAALAKGAAIRDFLRAEGWPDPVEADSGNGSHDLYRVDLPNDEASRDLLSRVIQALRARFNDAAVEVDDKTFNAARICKLYGTIAAKGDDVPGLDRPHRRAALLRVPDEITPVPLALLEALAGPPPQQAARTTTDAKTAAPGPKQGNPEAGAQSEPYGDMADVPDDELLRRMFAASNGDAIKRVWHGDDGDFDGDASKGDLALCGYLASWTQKAAARIERLFDTSERSARPKWSGRPDYRARTIGKAVAECTWVYDPGVVNQKLSQGGAGANIDSRGFAGFAGSQPPISPNFSALPKALTADLLPVPKLEASLLPDTLRPWIRDAAKRIGCPVEFIAAPAIVALGAVTGRKIGIKPKQRDDWLVVPNLWGGVVGKPGALKTPGTSEGLKPLYRLEASARQEHEGVMATHEADKAVAKAKADGAKDDLKKKAKAGNASDEVLREIALRSVAGEDMAAPTCRRHIVNDATVEALGMRLAENPDGLLLHRDELTGFFRTLEKQGHESDRAFYLETWDGIGSFSYDRVGRGTLFIPSKCVSLFGTIQPGPLAAYLRNSATGERADGFAARLQILVYPDPPTTFVNVDEWPNTDAKNAAFAVFERLADLKPEDVQAEADAEDGIPCLRFDPVAQAFFDAWRTDLENRLITSDDSPLLIEHLAKYRSLLPSLALLFHLIDNEAGGPVTLTAIERAAAWCEYLEKHARRVYQAVMDGDPEAAIRLSARIKQSLPNPFHYRDVVKKGWAGLSTTEEVERAVGVLEDRGWVQTVEKPAGEKGGRPTVEVFIHPDLIAPPEDKKTSTSMGLTTGETGETPPDDDADEIVEVER